MIITTLILILLIISYLFVADKAMGLIFKKFKLQYFEVNGFLSLFYRTLIFSIILVSLFAIISAKGKTIFIFSLPIFYLLIKNSQSNSLITTNIGSQISKYVVWYSILILVSLIVLLSFYFILRFSIRNDTAYYVKISEYLSSHGTENLFHYYNVENGIFKGIAPYHYFEMWFGGFFFKINKLVGFNLLSNYLFYIFFVLNLFRIIAVIGIFGLIAKYTKFSPLFFLIVIPILVIDISAFCNWGTNGFVAESNFFKRPNFIFYYLFLIPVFDSVLNNNRLQLIIWSSMFIITTITAIPAVASALILKISYDWINNKDHRKTIFTHTLFFLVFIILVLVFYKIFGASKEAMPVEKMSASQMLAKTLSIWKACLYMFTMLSVKIGIFIAFTFILIWKKTAREFRFDKNFTNLLIFTCLICFSGIGLFQLVPYLDNMYQFAFIGYCAVVLMLMVVISIKILQFTPIKKYLYTTIALIIVFIGFKRNLIYEQILIGQFNWSLNVPQNFLIQHGLSKKYINEMKELAPLLRGKKGASIIDAEDATQEFIGLRHSATFQLGNYLMAFNNEIHHPLLSDPSFLYLDKDTLSKDYYKALNFNRNTLFYRTYNSLVSYKENLRKYLLSKNIQYVFASKNANPYYYFDSLSILKIVADENKGHQLILFKNIEKNNL